MKAIVVDQNQLDINDNNENLIFQDEYILEQVLDFYIQPKKFLEDKFKYLWNQVST